jgi:UDP-N-acetylglucosamine 2-epimerase
VKECESSNKKRFHLCGASYTRILQNYATASEMHPDYKTRLYGDGAASRKIIDGLTSKCEALKKA